MMCWKHCFVMPAAVASQLARKCGWGGSRSKVQRALAALKKRGLANKHGDDWVLTKRGKALAEELIEVRHAKNRF